MRVGANRPVSVFIKTGAQEKVHQKFDERLMRANTGKSKTMT